MLTLEGARLVIADHETGGLRMIVAHGGLPFEIIIDPADRAKLRAWLNAAPVADPPVDPAGAGT